MTAVNKGTRKPTAEQQKTIDETPDAIGYLITGDGFLFIETKPPENLQNIIRVQPSLSVLENQQQCPNCGKWYTPVLTRKHPEMKIQDEFPDAPAWQREQHLSAICSDKCWKEWLGLDEGGEE